MAYNPLDDKGYQKIEVGDIVRATGKIDESFFEGRELMAESVVKLIDWFTMLTIIFCNDKFMWEVENQAKHGHPNI